MKEILPGDLYAFTQRIGISVASPGGVPWIYERAFLFDADLQVARGTVLMCVSVVRTSKVPLEHVIVIISGSGQFAQCFGDTLDHVATKLTCLS